MSAVFAEAAFNCVSVHSNDANRKAFVLVPVVNSLQHASSSLNFDLITYNILSVLISSNGKGVSMDHFARLVPQTTGEGLQANRLHRTHIAAALNQLTQSLVRDTYFKHSLSRQGAEYFWKNPTAPVEGVGHSSDPILRTVDRKVVLDQQNLWVKFEGIEAIHFDSVQVKILAELIAAPRNIIGITELATKVWGENAPKTENGQYRKLKKELDLIRERVQRRHPDFNHLEFVNGRVRLFKRTSFEPRVFAGFRVSGVVLEQATRTVKWKDFPPFQISAREQEILELLLTFPGEILTKREVFEATRGGDYVASLISRNIQDLILNFREVDPSFARIVVNPNEILWDPSL